MFWLSGEQVKYTCKLRKGKYMRSFICVYIQNT